MKCLLTIAALAAAGTAFAQGTSQAILGYTPGLSVNVNGITAGWTFQPTSPLTVTTLGCFTNVFYNNPVASVQVGLWAANGSLLASSTVSSSSALFDQTRYESITPVQIIPGQTYALGVFYPGNLGLDLVDAFVGGSLQVAPEIQPPTVASGSGGFAAPTPEPGSPLGAYLGPNFRYERGVPEPSTWLLLVLGGVFLAARRR